MYQTIKLSTVNQRFTIPFHMDESSTNMGRLEFHLGEYTTGLMLDNIEIGCTTICPMVLDIENLTPGGVHQASNSIHINTDISGTTNVELKAGNLISLETGFASGNSNFRVRIEDCAD